MLRKVCLCAFVLWSFGWVSTALAQSTYEREQIRLMLVQITNIEAIALQMDRNTSVLDTDRYQFDHVRFQKDLGAIRAGLEHYLTPARAQPRDVVDVVGEYQQEKSANHGND